jgi:predicted nucleotidyltransferase
MITKSGLADALFSQVKQRVLRILFSEPTRAFGMSEIVRLADSGSGAVQRELARLAEAGLVIMSKSEGRTDFQVNRTSPIFRELRGIIEKTVGLVGPIAEALRPLRPGIQAAFVYGSVARGSDKSDSDIDLMVLSDALSYAEVYRALHAAEKVIRRPINPTVMTPDEWRTKVVRGNTFAAKLGQKPRLFVIGTGHDIRRTG